MAHAARSTTQHTGAWAEGEARQRWSSSSSPREEENFLSVTMVRTRLDAAGRVLHSGKLRRRLLRQQGGSVRAPGGTLVKWQVVCWSQAGPLWVCEGLWVDRGCLPSGLARQGGRRSSQSVALTPSSALPAPSSLPPPPPPPPPRFPPPPYHPPHISLHQPGHTSRGGAAGEPENHGGATAQGGSADFDALDFDIKIVDPQTTNAHGSAHLVGGASRAPPAAPRSAAGRSGDDHGSADIDAAALAVRTARPHAATTPEGGSADDDDHRHRVLQKLFPCPGGTVPPEVQAVRSSLARWCCCCCGRRL